MYPVRIELVGRELSAVKAVREQEQRDKGKKHVDSHYIKSQGFPLWAPILLAGIVGTEAKRVIWLWGDSRWALKQWLEPS